MNWTAKALTLFVLDYLLLWPATMIPATLAVAYFHPTLAALMLLPTLLLCAAIALKDRWGKLPAWAWMFNTPDSPSSPYDFYEQAAAPYYKFGSFIGDYLWFAWRNRWYGLALKWGHRPDTTAYKFIAEGDMNVASKVDGKMVYGTFRCRVIKPDGTVVAWGIKRLTKTGPLMWKEQWGWKTLEDFYLKSPELQKAQNIKPPAMLAMQIYPRKAA